MRTIYFENKLYMVKKETDKLFLCQLINSEGNDIGTNGILISEIPPMERWKNSGTRIISKTRLKNDISAIKEFNLFRKELKI